MYTLNQIYKINQKGKIPEGWKIPKLKEISVGITDGTHFTPTYTKEGVPFLRVTDIQSKEVDWNNTKRISAKQHNELIKRCKPEKGDILLSKNGTIGITKLVDWNIPFSIFVSLCLIKPDHADVNNKFLTYVLCSDLCVGQIRLRSKQETVTNLHLEEIKELLIPLPPRPEQDKITYILSKVDELIQKTDQVIEQTQKLKKGLMPRLLTKGIGATIFKTTNIGKIPDEWQVVKLSEVCSKVIGGGTPSTTNPDYWNGDIHWMRSAWIKGRYIITGEKLLTKLGLDNSATHIVPKNNLLIATRVSIGNVAINKIDIAISQDLTGIIIDSCKADVEYLYWVFLKLENTIKSFTQGTTIKGLTRQALKNIEIAVPNLSEQQKIASILSKIDEHIHIQLDYKLQLQTLKKGLMQKLLTGKIRVKV